MGVVVGQANFVGEFNVDVGAATYQGVDAFAMYDTPTGAPRADGRRIYTTKVVVPFPIGASSSNASVTINNSSELNGDLPNGPYKIWLILTVSRNGNIEKYSPPIASKNMNVNGNNALHKPGGAVTLNVPNKAGLNVGVNGTWTAFAAFPPQVPVNYIAISDIVVNAMPQGAAESVLKLGSIGT